MKEYLNQVYMQVEQSLHNKMAKFQQAYLHPRFENFLKNTEHYFFFFILSIYKHIMPIL